MKSFNNTKGEYLYSLTDTAGGRKDGEVVRVQKEYPNPSNKQGIWYFCKKGRRNTTKVKEFRFATEEEILKSQFKEEYLKKNGLVITASFKKGDYVYTDKKYTSSNSVQKVFKVEGSKVYIDQLGWWSKEDTRFATKGEILSSKYKEEYLIANHIENPITEESSIYKVGSIVRFINAGGWGVAEEFGNDLGIVKETKISMSDIFRISGEIIEPNRDKFDTVADGKGHYRLATQEEIDNISEELKIKFNINLKSSKNEESSTINVANTRRSSCGELKISFGGCGDGLKTSRGKRKERSVSIGTDSRRSGEGLHPRRRASRSIEVGARHRRQEGRRETPRENSKGSILSQKDLYKGLY